uniref:Uncharacterized protein n=1 Tax=Mycena chlorophos TaxID=658473 RepID=A0ABQ0L2E2_MYCCL|nr:predicted protein [Mycena chlorophos]
MSTQPPLAPLLSEPFQRADPPRPRAAITTVGEQESRLRQRMVVEDSTTVPSGKGIIFGNLRLGDSLYGVVGTTSGDLLASTSGPTLQTVFSDQLYTIFLPKAPQYHGRFDIIAAPRQPQRRLPSLFPEMVRNGDTWKLGPQAQEKWLKLESHLSLIGQALFKNLSEKDSPLSELQLPPPPHRSGYTEVYYNQDACKKALTSSREAFLEQAAALTMLLLLHRAKHLVTDQGAYWTTLLGLLRRETSLSLPDIQSILEHSNITGWSHPRQGAILRVPFAPQRTKLRAVAEQLINCVGWFQLPIPIYIAYGSLAPLLTGIPSHLRLSHTFYPASDEIAFLRGAPGIAFSAWRKDPKQILLHPDAPTWSLSQLDENDFVPQPPEEFTQQLVGETYAEFVARRREINAGLAEHETEGQRDKRQTRERKELKRGLPTRSTRVFVWERRGQQQIRVLIEYDAYPRHWVRYHESRCFYDSFHHEWDLCHLEVEFLETSADEDAGAGDDDEIEVDDDEIEVDDDEIEVDDDEIEVDEEDSESMPEEAGGSEDEDDDEEENESESLLMRGPASLGPSFVFPYCSLKFSVFDELEQQMGIVIPMSQRQHFSQEV